MGFYEHVSASYGSINVGNFLRSETNIEFWGNAIGNFENIS